MPPGGRVEFTSYTMEGAGRQCVVGVQKTVNVSRRPGKPFVYCIGLPSVPFANDVKVMIARQNARRFVRG
jgi:hypothetical protein